MASAMGNMSETKSLVKKMKKKKTLDLDYEDGEGRIALLFAAYHERTDIVDFLIKEGANVNKANHSGMTALLLTISTGNLEIVKHLVAKGAQVNLANKGGESPLWVAAKFGHVDIMTFLVKKGAKLDQDTTEGAASRRRRRRPTRRFKVPTGSGKSRRQHEDGRHRNDSAFPRMWQRRLDQRSISA